MPQGKRNQGRKPSDRRASQGIYIPIDVHVGTRIRQRRTLLGMSQSALGEKVGLTFQQIQKYERGSNRVSSSRLFDIAHVLEVAIVHFFEDIPGDVKRKSPAQLAGSFVNAPSEEAADPLVKRETLELVRAYYAIPERALRRRLVDLIRTLSSSLESEDETEPRHRKSER